MGSTISASVYITIYIKFVPPTPGGKARAQNGVSGSFLGAVFEVVADEETEIWTNLSCSFIKGGLLQLPGL